MTSKRCATPACRNIGDVTMNGIPLCIGCLGNLMNKAKAEVLGCRDKVAELEAERDALRNENRLLLADRNNLRKVIERLIMLVSSRCICHPGRPCRSTYRDTALRMLRDEHGVRVSVAKGVVTGWPDDDRGGP